MLKCSEHVVLSEAKNLLLSGLEATQQMLRCVQYHRVT
jgi:hypothetical protein